MKAYNIGLILLLLTLAGTLCAQDTVYVMQNGSIKYRRALIDIDSVSFVNPLNTRKNLVQKMAQDAKFTLFMEALNATGLTDSLRADKDDSYRVSEYFTSMLVGKNNLNWYYEECPTNRLYGFTAFVESNETLSKYGINGLSELKAFAKTVYDQVYPEDAGVEDVTNRKNSLNRFIAYHLITRRLSTNTLIDAYDTDHMLKTCDMFEYLETMCPNTLLEISKIRSTGKTNQINRSSITGNTVQILASSENDPRYNGIFHEIDQPLIYSNAVQSELSGKRLRFDFAALLPELNNNNLRGRGMTQPNLQFKLPPGFIKRINISALSSLNFMTPYYKFQDYEGDELGIKSSYNGVYDFSVELPPIPAGSYEIRFGYLTNGNRGVAELFLDNQPVGAPINLNMNGTHIEIGNVTPGSDTSDPMGYENDKVMRNHGYMKGPANYKVPMVGWSFGENARMCSVIVRKILGVYSFSTATTHLLTVKGLSPGEFQLDFIEFVPTSLLETEDIY